VTKPGGPLKDENMGNQKESTGVDMSEITELQKHLRDFADTRDWAKFHSPRNLILALGSEIGELQGEVRWKTDEEISQADPELRERLASEMADVSIFLLRLFDVLALELSDCVKKKLESNGARPLNGPDFSD